MHITQLLGPWEGRGGGGGRKNQQATPECKTHTHLSKKNNKREMLTMISTIVTLVSFVAWCVVPVSGNAIAFGLCTISVVGNVCMDHMPPSEYDLLP